MKKCAPIILMLCLLACEKSAVITALELVLANAELAIKNFGGTPEQQAIEREIVRAALACVEQTSTNSNMGVLALSQECAAVAGRTLPPGLPQGAASAIAAVLSAVQQVVAARGPVAAPGKTGKAAPTPVVVLSDDDKKAMPKLRQKALQLKERVSQVPIGEMLPGQFRTGQVVKLEYRPGGWYALVMPVGGK